MPDPVDHRITCPVCEGEGRVWPQEVGDMPDPNAVAMLLLTPPPHMSVEDVEATAQALKRTLQGWAVTIGEGMEVHDA